MTVTKEIIAAKVEEMAKLSKEKATLDLRYKELEAFFLKLGGKSSVTASVKPAHLMIMTDMTLHTSKPEQ